MIKKLLVLGMAATMLTCVGCGSVKTEETELASYEETIEASEEIVDDLSTEIANLYVEAVKTHFGENLDESKITCDNSGVYYDERFVSWEYLETVAYNSMINDL